MLAASMQGVTPSAHSCAFAVLQTLAGSLTEEANIKARAPNGSQRDSL